MLRVYVESDDASKLLPVLVVVRHERGVVSWELPMRILDQDTKEDDTKDDVFYTAVNRTLCPLRDYKVKGRWPASSQNTSHTVSISISTASAVRVGFKVSLYLQDQFVVAMNRSHEARVTPSAPQFFQFTWPEEVDTAIISVDSNQSVCMTLSVQNITCPVYDLANNVGFEGMYQTVDLRTGMSITKKRFPHGIHIVFVVKGTDDACHVGKSLMPHTVGSAENCHGPCRDKTVKFKITKKISRSEYYLATFGAVLLFCGAYLIVVLISCILCIPKMKDIPTMFRREDTLGVNYNSMDNDDVPVGGRGDVERISTISDDTDDDLDMLTDVDVDKEIVRSKPVLFLSDLARKKPQMLSRKSSLYQWNLVTIATFYGLPVIQLVVTYQQVLNQTGNEDLCYYNFLCAHPWGLLSDFNHVFSNLGYVMLGGLFMIIVWRRDILYSRFLAENPGADRKYGVPHHCGLFYAMGFALIMEGFMSACYHVCPNHSNFQFDTAFMYTIAILSMLKIYQFRHPDLHASAYKSFGVLAFVIFVGVLGVVDSNTTFWVFFTAIYIFTVIMVSVQLYYRGRWSLDLGTPRRICKMIHHDITACLHGSWSALRPQVLDRFVLIIVWNIINFSLAGVGVNNI